MRWYPHRDSGRIGAAIKVVRGALLAAFVMVIAYIVMTAGNKNKDIASNEIKLEQLKALPYVSWSEGQVDKNNKGVTLKMSEATKGYNIFTDNEQSVYLMDMNGTVVHSWNLPSKGRWEHVELMDDGNIAVLDVGREKSTGRVCLPCWRTEIYSCSITAITGPIPV